MYKKFLVVFFIPLVLACPIQLRAEITPDEQQLISKINTPRMMSTIERLCSDEFNGRRAGSPEHYFAADYLASKFAEYGLAQAPGMDGYKQPFTMKYALIRSKDENKATLSYGIPSRIRTFAYRGFNGRGGLNFNSEVVFVGYGIHDPDAGYDDYAGLDVNGKIVLWLSGQPKGVTLKKPVTGFHKIAAAYQHGAVACLMCKPAEIKDEWGTNIGLSGSIADFPYIAVDKKIASEIMGCDVGKLDASQTPAGKLGAKVYLQVTQVCDPERKTYNIVGMIPGSDPEKADEIIMIGAHYDHLGDTPNGEIFRGADDNASGISVILEVMNAIKESCLTPRRNIVFASWTGEEAGLVGSNYFGANPPFPLDRIVSNIELDMVGCGTPGAFMTTGASAYPEHYRRLETSASDLNLVLHADVVAGASDHLAFTRKKVPTSLIYSEGEHPNFHTIRDTPDKIDRVVLGSAARLVVLAIWRAANG